jgi:DNA-binding NtrC family response regulator
MNSKSITGGQPMSQNLIGKRILIVDDEPDIFETLNELLDMCSVDYAQDFKTAEKYLSQNYYDAVILDIMGVDGYNLLNLARQREIPALMLTAHALSPDHLVKSIKQGAFSYIPKHEMADIPDYLDDVIQAKLKDQKPKKWFGKLSPFFNRKFGADWQNQHREFIRDFNLAHTKEELEKIL